MFIIVSDLVAHSQTSEGRLKTEARLSVASKRSTNNSVSAADSPRVLRYFQLFTLSDVVRKPNTIQHFLEH